MSSVPSAASTIPIRIVLLFTAAAIFSGVGLAIWNQYSSSNYDSKQDAKSNTIMMQQQQDYNTLSSQIVILNATIYAQTGELNFKIMLVNMSLSEQITFINSNLTNIYEILNISAGNATSFVNYVNNSLISITGDVNNLQMNVTDLSNNVTNIYNNLTTVWGQLDNLEATKLETINGVPGDSANKNINLVSVNDNLVITPSPGNNTVYFNVPESLMTLEAENGPIVPNSMGQIFITGGPDGLIDFNASGANTGVINASVIATMLQNQNNDISTLSMQIVAMNQTINAQNATLTMLENFILNILNFNISGNLNMSIAALVYNVTVLQATVVDLQTQINNIQANTSSVAVGSILPFVGTTMTIPTGYLFCNGATVNISDYTSLYNVILRRYCTVMVDNMTQFCLPDMRGRTPVGQGGTSFTSQSGSQVGGETTTLTNANLPLHTHSIPSLTTTAGQGRHGHDILLGGPTVRYRSQTTMESSGYMSRKSADAVNGAGNEPSVEILDGYSVDLMDIPNTRPSSRNSDPNDQRGILFSANTRTYGADDCTTTPLFGALPYTYTKFNSETAAGIKKSLVEDQLCETDSAHLHTTTASNTGNGPGSASGVNIIQPSIVVNYIIKY